MFGIGPAGTGKTYLAMAKAVQALQRKEVSRIILTRPAVEAGERLGFLPGTLNDKIDPYLRPLYDALNEMMDPELVPKLLASGTIEVAPLAYMRGRTLNDSFVVLDEAQNTTPEQMKMFLTRLGFGTRMVVTGDITQIDLPQGAQRASAGTRVLERHRRHPLLATSRATTSCGTPSSAASSTPTPSTTSAAAQRERDEAPEFANRAERRGSAARPLPKEGAHDDRDQQRVRDRGRRDRRSCDWRIYTLAELHVSPTPTSRSCSSTRAPWSSCTCSGWTSPAPPTC